MSLLDVASSVVQRALYVHMIKGIRLHDAILIMFMSYAGLKQVFLFWEYLVKCVIFMFNTSNQIKLCTNTIRKLMMKHATLLLIQEIKGIKG